MFVQLVAGHQFVADDLQLMKSGGNFVMGHTLKLTHIFFEKPHFEHSVLCFGKTFTDVDCFVFKLVLKFWCKGFTTE